jgi:RHS repeat-associated protein
MLTRGNHAALVLLVFGGTALGQQGSDWQKHLERKRARDEAGLGNSLGGLIVLLSGPNVYNSFLAPLIEAGVDIELAENEANQGPKLPQDTNCNVTSAAVVQAGTLTGSLASPSITGLLFGFEGGFLGVPYTAPAGTTDLGTCTKPQGSSGQSAVAHAVAPTTTLTCPNANVDGFPASATATITTTTNGQANVSLNVTYKSNGKNEAFTGTASVLSGSTHACTNDAPAGDDISTYTGEVYLNFPADLDLGGPLPLRFQRYYASLLSLNGVFTLLGANWMSNFDTQLVPSTFSGGSPTDVAIVRFGGKSVRFHQSGGTWQLVTPERYADQLIQSGAEYQYFSVHDNLLYAFNIGSGALTRIQDRNGNQLTVTRSQTNQITLVSDGLGRTLTFTYDSSGYLSKVTDESGRSISMGHGGQSFPLDLTSFTDAAGKTTTFTYTYPFTGSAMASETLPLGNTIYTQTYDAVGRVIKQTDGLGNATSLAYSATGGATTVTDALGNKSSYTYGTPTLVTSYSDGLNSTGTFAYDSNSRPTMIMDRNGNKETITYHASGFPASITDPNGNTTSFTYAASTFGGFTAYDLTGVTYADGTSVSFTRDANGNVTKYTDAAGFNTSYTYNSRGQRLTMVNPLSGTTTYTYNSDGTLASVQTPAGDTTTLGYDTLKRVNQVKHPDATTIGYVYDAVDGLTQVTNERGKVTVVAYDDNGQLTGITDPLGNVTSFTYDAAGNVTTEKIPAGTTTNTYNADDFVKTITAPTGEIRTFGYDADLRPLTSADTVGQLAAVSWDNESGLTSLTDGAGRKSTFTPDPLGQVTTAATPLGESVLQTYDNRNRLASAKDPLALTSTWSYEPRGHLSSTTAPGSVTTSYARDGLGGLTSITDPNGNAWTTVHDSSGRTTSETDPLGNKVTYTYDSRNRRTGESSNVATVQYTYDAAGNRTASTYSDSTTIAYTFDDDNRPTGGTGATFTLDASGFINNSSGLAVGRDSSSRMNSITYPAGKATYTYNNRGLLSQVSDWAGGSVSFTYNAALQVTSITRSNGVTTAYTYDGDGRLIGVTESTGSTTLASIQFQRDADGRVTSEARNQPQTVTIAGGVSSFTYDAASQVVGFTYDALGRLKKDSLRTYVFDAATRVTSYQGSDGTASFTYDAFGMRISRASSGTTENYTINYATTLPTIAVVRSGGADRRYYIYTPDGVPLYWIDASGSAHHFLHYDELGNTVLLTGDNGAVTDSYGISPYGESVTQNGSTANPYTWQGAAGVMQEGLTSLYYVRARYYESATGRFLSRDPVQHATPREFDPYQYASGDPVDFFDPTGMIGKSISGQWAPDSPFYGSGQSPSSFAGNNIIYAAARDTTNSGWRDLGVSHISTARPVIAKKSTCTCVKSFFRNYCDGDCSDPGETCQGDSFVTIFIDYFTYPVHCDCYKGKGSFVTQ